ncbi:MAG: dihydrolipoyl dehydrogenase [Chloroflexi bacterium]|nr:MAG: dihydrolipoyl dehydrogenase [Chloroflexota bacterium]
MVEIQDLVVIGGGSGGFSAAMRATQLGGKVTVVEEAHYGGYCMHKACIPSKFLMTTARLMGRIRKAGRFGIQVEEPTLDMDALHDRKNLIIEGLEMGTEQLLADYGVTLIKGRGKLVARDIVEVNPSTSSGQSGEQIKARNVLIATGSAPAQLPIEGVGLPGVIGTEEAIELREIPPRIAILGSKPWHLELAQYFHALGSEVTLIESGPQLLPEADREISQRLGKLLHDAGIAIKRGVSVEALRQGDGDSLIVALAEGKGEIAADKVLAARRLPNTAGLGLRQLGVEMEHGAILVNEALETSVPHIYALGDATAGPMWSHKANAEGIISGENAMGLNSRMNYEILPRCLYTWPEVAWVGLTEEQAEAQGIEVEVGKVPTAINPYAMILDETAGTVKIIACKKYGKIVGAHILAPGAVNLVNVVAVAMLSEATVGELMRFIPMHPSIGEALVDAAMDVEKRSLHLPQW